MKKAVLSFAAAMLLAAPAVRAQYTDNDFTPYHNVEIGTGIVSIPFFAMTLGAVFGTAFSLGHFTVEDMYSTSALSAEYYYNFNPHVAVGGAAVFEYFGGDTYTKNSSTGEYEISGKYSGIFTSLMPAARFGWFSRDHFMMYSKVAAGGMLSDTGSGEDSSPQFTFAFQASPVCLSAGGGHCWGKLELGFGMMGLVQAGFVYRF